MKITILFLVSIILMGCHQATHLQRTQANQHTQTKPFPSSTNTVEVTVRMLVNPKGIIEKAYILKSSGQNTLDQKVLNAVKAGKLDPKLFRNTRGISIVDQPFIFYIDSLNTEK